MAKGKRQPKDESFYLEKAKQLLEYQETEEPEIRDGVKLPYIREENLTEILGMLKLNQRDVLGMLLRRGLLRKKTSNPKGYYICLEPLPGVAETNLRTKTVRKAAEKLIPFASSESKKGQLLRFLPRKEILSLLNKKGYDVDAMFKQLLKHYYLVQLQEGDDSSCYIFTFVSEGKKFKAENSH